LKLIRLLFVPLCFFITTTVAQDKVPSFGKIDKADLEIKDCDFDLNAEAIVLLDIGEIQFAYVQNVGWQCEADYRVRIKVLKASAIDRAQIKLDFYTANRYQDITNVSGISYNLDATGNVAETKLEKSAVYKKAIDKERSEISFALPEVKVGTVFEYKYKMTRKSYSYIPPWTFQQSIPVRYSAYNIIIPEYFHFTVQTTKRQPMEQKEGKVGNGNWYIMRKVPGLKKEPYSAGLKDYLQRVEFQLSKIDAPSFYQEYRTTWKKIIDELLESEDFGLAIKKNIKATGDLDATVKTATSVKEKVRLIYNYVQSNMQWNDEEGLYTNNGIKDAWDKKNANQADINFILIRLLRDADIDARAVIASTKDNGTINAVYPFLRQFNCVLAYVKDGDDIYIMNAADKYNPFNLIPYDVLYTNGLLIDKDNGALIGLNSNSDFINSVAFIGNIEADGKLSGSATISSAGYARNIRMSTHKKGKLKSMLEDNDGITIKVDSITVTNDKDELKPLDQKVDFSGSLQQSGDYLFLPYSFFTGIGKNPFVEEERVTDIDFDFPKNYIISGTYILPDNGYTISELPKNVKMILPDTSIILTRSTQKDGNLISFRLVLTFKASGYSADSYPYIKEFFKKLYEVFEEKIVLKKN
jgi:Domain of Unknown Function with PDB structure (DUF3857)/Transglutaminase-like superfamily